MIVKIPLVLALVVSIKDVSSSSFSKVFFQNGHDYPHEHIQYSAPSYSYSPHLAKLAAAPVSPVLPYSANFVPYSSSIYEYPGQVASVAPSAKFIQYPSSGVPLVVAPQRDLAGYEYSYVVYDDHKAQLESSDVPAAHGGYAFLQPEGFNTYVKSYVPTTEHVQHGHSGHSVAAPCHEVENEHLTAHTHHETHHTKLESSGESEENGHDHTPTHESHESHGHESHHEDHGHDQSHENHESHGHEGREDTEHPHELGHHGHEGTEHESHENDHPHARHDHPNHDHSGHHETSSSSSEEHGNHQEYEHPHGEHHDHAEHGHAAHHGESHAAHHGESHEGHERAHGHEEHDGSPESLEVTHEHEHHAETIHEKHTSHLEEMSSESIESEVHDLAASRNIEHSNVLVPYNDIIKCVQAAMHGASELSQPHHPESPLTYIVLNKPC